MRTNYTVNLNITNISRDNLKFIKKLNKQTINSKPNRQGYYQKYQTFIKQIVELEGDKNFFVSCYITVRLPLVYLLSRLSKIYKKSTTNKVFSLQQPQLDIKKQ